MALDKLVDSAQLDSDLASIASAIRTAGGTSAQLAFPSGFVTAIGNLSGGGGGSSDTWELILDHTVTLNLSADTSFDSITPSTTAQNIKSAVNGVKNSGGVMIETDAVDFATYSYVGIGIQTINFAWQSEPSAAGVPKMNYYILRIHPNLYTNANYDLWQATKGACFQRSDDSPQNRNNGVVLGGASFGTNATSTPTPKFRLQIGTIKVQANATYFPVADVQLIDSANTDITCVWKLWRSPRKSIDATQYDLVRSMLYPV